MDADAKRKLIQAIHRSGHAMVLAITGGGASAIGELLLVPGGSASILEAVVPYSWNALIDWLGGKPDTACSAPTARSMAMAAFQRARQLAGPSTPVDKLIGVGCTASLASDRPKRGAHRFHVAFQSSAFTDCFSLELDKGRRTRAQEEVVVVGYLLARLVKWCDSGMAALPADAALSHEDFPALDRGSSGEVLFQVGRPEWQKLLLDQVSACNRQAQVVRPGEPLRGERTVFPGAFNPMHAGHRRMAEYASTRLGRSCEFEISIANVDKPPLDYLEIAKRIDSFQLSDQVWLTRAPTFVEKSAIFPGCTFVVGVDTITRIADPKYANNDVRVRDEVISTLARRGCRFLVFGRAEHRRFHVLGDVAIPDALRRLCDEVPASDFREDVSSTELRRQQEQQQQ